MPFIRTNNWTVEQIAAYIAEGKSMSEISEIIGLSRQRIKQICQRHSLPSTVKTRQELKARTYFLKWGERSSSDLYQACRQKFRNKKAAAKQAGVEWSIQFGELEWPEKCPILGLELDYFAEGRQENSPSFDRIDPSKGYVSGNVVVVSWRANRIKNDGSASEHHSIAAWLEKLCQ